MAAELHQRHGIKFKLTHRIRCFCESTGLSVVTFALSATVFALTSLAFGLISLGASYAMGMSELATDVAFVGTVGGMVWGAAGGMLPLVCALDDGNRKFSAPPPKDSDLSSSQFA